MITKLRTKKGGLATILAYVIVFLPLVYLMLLGFTWQIRDSTEQHINRTIRTAIDITIKKGVFDNSTKLFIKQNIDKFYLPNEYKVTIGYQHENDIGGNNSTITKVNLEDISLSNTVNYKVRDVAYIQFEIMDSKKEPMVSRLMKLISRKNNGMDKMLIVQQGMVEVNGE